MKTYELSDMIKGWFVGDFDPASFRTNACEVACKQYKAGESEGRHVHRIATEITLVVHGRVAMNGRSYSAGSIIVLEPGEATDFSVKEDATTVVVKVPSVVGDKYAE
ncbi:MAG: hypothetical protein E8D45_04850 [Nitrospira sp.]|nr:MAG: hypothetical protein E8D45_04850 [Nitrospira sp.]